MMTTSADQTALIEAVAERAREAGVFGAVSTEAGRVVCQAADSAEPAEYRVDAGDDGVWVSLVTKNRWLSESIEANLMHTGDKLGELLEEELVDVGFDQDGPAAFQHYRSDDMLFTFRSQSPASDSETVVLWLLGYEQCFRELGDMSDSGDE